jgi:hypothetical protein
MKEINISLVLNIDFFLRNESHNKISSVFMCSQWAKYLIFCQEQNVPKGVNMS